jgi:hypothetical protein
MAERFTGCDQLGGFAWAQILSRGPEFADCCDWSKISQIDMCGCVQSRGESLLFLAVQKWRWREVRRECPQKNKRNSIVL